MTNNGIEYESMCVCLGLRGWDGGIGEMSEQRMSEQ